MSLRIAAILLIGVKPQSINGDVSGVAVVTTVLSL